MDLRHLEYVLEVARSRNVTQAAANLGVAQPAISQAITSLERQFGVTLFDRTSRPVQPTPAGLKFIEQATLVLGEVKGLQDVADAHASLLRGRLTIGTNYWVGVTLLPALLVDFHKLYPGITFVLRREPLARLVDSVRSGEFDVAFVDLPATAKLPDLECHPFREDEFVVYVTPGHHFSERTEIRLEDLGSEPFIAFEQESSMYGLFTQAAKAAGFTPNVVASTQSQSVARSLVSQGLGISVGSKELIEVPGPPVHGIPLVPRVAKGTMLVLKGRSEPNNITRPFVKFVGERCGIAMQ